MEKNNTDHITNDQNLIKGNNKGRLKIDKIKKMTISDVI